MDSASTLTSQDVELSPPITLSMSVSSDTESEDLVNQELESDVRIHHKIFSLCKNISEISMQCFGLVLIIWFLVSVALIAIIYGSQTVRLGPSSSVLTEANPILVESIKVEILNDSKSGLELLGFYRTPSLDVFVNWSESRLSPLSHNSYKGWPYYLNKGSFLNISYRVKPERSSVQFVVKKGGRDISESLNGAAVLNNALSWNLIHGSGLIGLKINESSSYYVAVANLKRKDVMVDLDIEVKAILYDTKESFYKCTFSNGHCSFNAMSLVGRSFVLTSPALSQGDSMEELEEWFIRFSYQPRWITYVIITGLVVCFMVVAIRLWDWLQCWYEYEERDQNDSARTPLLENKDKNDSYYDADLDEYMVVEGEASRRVCIICFDAPRDCFFLPCGHCMSCYKCGKKILRTNGKCPICRRKMKKVKRIYRV